MTDNIEKIGDELIFNEISILDFLDEKLMAMFHFTEDQYDNMCEHASDQELKVVTNLHPTFTEKKQIATILKKYRNGNSV